MKLLYRYLYKKLAVYLLVLVPSFAFVGILAEVVEILRKVKNLDYQAILLYVLYQTPEKVYYILPVSMVVALFLLARDLVNSREIYPILLNGISLRRLGVALFIFPVVVSLLQVANLELIMPEAKKRAEDIYSFLKKRPQNEPLIAYNTWVAIDKDRFVYFSFLDLKSKNGKGIVAVEYTPNFTPKSVIEGKRFFVEKGIKIYDGKKVVFSDDKDISLERFSVFILQTKVNLEELKKLIKVKKPVSIRQLYHAAVIAEKFGYPSSYYWSKMFSSLASVISPLVLSVAFYPLVWGRKKVYLVLMAVSLLVYWYATAFLTSLAQSNVIPYYGIFAVDIVYLIVGLFLFSRLKFPQL
ncbi:MAG: LptF/LptG family permease [Aquificae bacterium]|nr:LptF/LptG family permease [Aquificota bacterium]